MRFYREKTPAYRTSIAEDPRRPTKNLRLILVMLSTSTHASLTTVSNTHQREFLISIINSSESCPVFLVVWCPGGSFLAGGDVGRPVCRPIYAEPCPSTRAESSAGSWVLSFRGATSGMMHTCLMHTCLMHTTGSTPCPFLFSVFCRICLVSPL